MALMKKYFLSFQLGNNILANGIKTSAVKLLDQDHRKKLGLPRNPNRFGPLTDWGDYTFNDGRPTPLGVRQYNRVKKQQQLAKKILKLTREIDYAVERQQLLQLEAEKAKQEVLSKKLEAKGEKLLQLPAN